MLNSDQVAKSIVELNRKKYIVSLIKTVIFWAVALTALYFSGRNNDIFGPHTRPVPFYSVGLLLVLIPVFRYRLYRVFTRPSFIGVADGGKNGSTMAQRTDILIGIHGGLEKVAIYTLSVISNRNRSYRFIFSAGMQSNYARECMKKGTRVRYAFGGRYPWSEETPPEYPFCPNCGAFGAINETHCSCGCLYLQESSDKKERKLC